jgi:hypothetical protein
MTLKDKVDSIKSWMKKEYELKVESIPKSSFDDFEEELKEILFPHLIAEDAKKKKAQEILELERIKDKIGRYGLEELNDFNILSWAEEIALANLKKISRG